MSEKGSLTIFLTWADWCFAYSNFDPNFASDLKIILLRLGSSWASNAGPWRSSVERCVGQLRASPISVRKLGCLEARDKFYTF